MAKIQKITFVDDLDGREVEPDDVHNVSWTWLGVDYELDVSEANLDKIESGKVTIAKLLEVSTRVGGRKRSTTSRTAAVATDATRNPQRTNKIRSWAAEAGYDVAPRGRIAREVVAAYDEAH